MILILFIGLFILLLLAYLLNYGDILSPWFVLVTTFCASTFVSLINVGSWQFSISIDTVVLILFALFSFGIGETLSKALFIRPDTIIHDFSTPFREPIIISQKILIISLLFAITMAIYQYNYIMNIAIENGWNPQKQYMLSYIQQYVHNRVKHAGIDGAALFSLCSTIFDVLSHVFIALFIFNKIYFNHFKNNIRYMYILPFYFMFKIYGGGRVWILYLLIYIFILTGILLRWQGKWNGKPCIRLLKYLMSVIIIFFCLFWILGFLTGKTTRQDYFEIFSIYAGTSIPLFDIFLSNPTYSDFFGQHTFLGIWRMMLRFGIPIRIIGFEDNVFKFAKIGLSGPSSSNLYTSLFVLVRDFGIYGMLVVELICGFLAGLMYRRIIKNKASFSFLIIYGILFSSFVLWVLAEGLLQGLFGIIFIIKVYLIYWLFHIILYFNPQHKKLYINKKII